jgi:hypothetical protein
LSRISSEEAKQKTHPLNQALLQLKANIRISIGQGENKEVKKLRRRKRNRRTSWIRLIKR